MCVRSSYLWRHSNTRRPIAAMLTGHLFHPLNIQVKMIVLNLFDAELLAVVMGPLVLQSIVLVAPMPKGSFLNRHKDQSNGALTLYRRNRSLDFSKVL